MSEVKIAPSQLIGVKAASREFGRILDEIEKGAPAKVITRRGKPVAILARLEKD